MTNILCNVQTILNHKHYNYDNWELLGYIYNWRNLNN